MAGFTPFRAQMSFLIATGALHALCSEPGAAIFHLTCTNKLILLYTLIFGVLLVFDYFALNKLSRTTPATAAPALIIQGFSLAQSVEKMTNQSYEKKDG